MTTDLHYVANDEDELEFIHWFWHGTKPWLAVDTETTGLDPWHDTLRMVQFGDTETGWALPFPERASAVALALTSERAFVFHREKFDVQFLKNAGLDVSGVRMADDTKIMLHLLDPSQPTSLKPNAVKFLGADCDAADKALHHKMRAEKWTWATVPKDEPLYWGYAALDPVLTARLAERLFPEVRDRYADLYLTELLTADAVTNAERRGMRIDEDYVREQIAVLEVEVEALRTEWPGINLNAPAQVGAALEVAGFRLTRTKTGKVQATAAALEQIDHPLARARLEMADVSKTLNTYFRNFLELAVDGYIHPTINTVGPRTGRMSCERPNLQNVPRGSLVRPAFVASPGRTLVRSDYAQIEYRLFASIANEGQMIQAFLDGKDMHAETARIILGREPTTEERVVAKTANFAMLYGAGTAKFAQTAGIPLGEAEDFMRAYVEHFPGVPRFMDAAMRYVKGNGMAVDTIYGRRCPVDGGQLYAGVNYMIQGTAADVLKQAICRVAETEWGEYFVLPVHDELIFDVPEDEADELVEALPDLMEVKDKFAVPLTVEVKRQHRWGVDDEEVKEAA